MADRRAWHGQGGGGPSPRETSGVDGWFVTASHGRYVGERESAEWLPTGQAHLKELGVSHTECGVSASGWKVFWLLDPTALADLCPDCLSRTRRVGRPRAGRPSARSTAGPRG